MSPTKAELLQQLFSRWAGKEPDTLHKLPGSGSSREYFRIRGAERSAIGVINSDREENEAFVSFTRHFRSLGLPVPELYLVDLDRDAYLQEDLGDTTLFEHLLEIRQEGSFPEELKDLYRKVLDELLRFQVEGAAGLDFSVCYPRSGFDRQSMQWDLSYFKYYFLKLADIPFHEQRLEDDFQELIGFLSEQDRSWFLYRDFQSRNIMIRDGRPWFIDYQGGRRGALAYDVASLLYDAKADIPPPVRTELLEHYLRGLSRYPDIEPESVRASFFPHVLIRMMQAMGAYGFRGFYEKKSHFLQSIPYALQTLKWVLENGEFPFSLPTLFGVLENLESAPALQKFRESPEHSSALNVSINSFSYRQGIPDDPSGHGGGYVFDCRVITNPGKQEQYRELTGRDRPVIEFLDSQSDAKQFIDHARSMVEMSVSRYRERGFQRLMVSFGCTGGQHRSVWCAEQLASHLRSNPGVRVTLWHRELD